MRLCEKKIQTEVRRYLTLRDFEPSSNSNRARCIHFHAKNVEKVMNSPHSSYVLKQQCIPFKLNLKTRSHVEDEKISSRNVCGGVFILFVSKRFFLKNQTIGIIFTSRDEQVFPHGGSVP